LEEQLRSTTNLKVVGSRCGSAARTAGRLGALALCALALVIPAVHEPAGAAVQASACPFGWASSSTPARTPPGGMALRGVAVAGPYDAWAVGSMYSHGDLPETSHSLIEHWDGARWQRVVTSPVASD